MAGFVALHHAMIRATGRNQPDKIEAMLAQGADPLFRNKERKCALDLSIEAKSEACLFWLIPVSDLNAENPRGDTPFLSAVRARWATGAQMLLPGSNPRRPSASGQSALMIATAAAQRQNKKIRRKKKRHPRAAWVGKAPGGAKRPQKKFMNLRQRGKIGGSQGDQP